MLRLSRALFPFFTTIFLNKMYRMLCCVCRSLWSLPCKAGRGLKTTGEATEGGAEAGVEVGMVGGEATGVTGAVEVCKQTLPCYLFCTLHDISSAGSLLCTVSECSAAHCKVPTLRIALLDVATSGLHTVQAYTACCASMTRHML